MRIVAGKYRGRRIPSPPGQTARPTTDRMRESLFSMLQSRHALQDAQVVDAFAGSGALGLEALSRGAAFCAFFDASSKIVDHLRETVQTFRANAQCVVLKRDSTRLGDNQHRPANLVFLDPPYRKSLVNPTLKRLQDKNWIAPKALVVIETASDEDLIIPDGFTLEEARQFGGSKVWFLRFASIDQTN